MLKKAVYGTAVAATLGGLVLGTDLMSYVRTSASSVRDAVKSEVPVEFEISRAREMIDDLVPAIGGCMRAIAQQEVDIEHRHEEIARKSEELQKQEELMLARKAELDSGKEEFDIRGRTYSADQLRVDLKTRLERCKVLKSTVDTEKQIVEAREKALKSNHDKLDGMIVAKRDLEVQVEQLEARLQAVRAAETVTTLEIDNSDLAQAKKLIRSLNKQLDVRENMLDADGKFTGLIPVESAEVPVPENVEAEVGAYFNDDVVTVQDTQLAKDSESEASNGLDIPVVTTGI